MPSMTRDPVRVAVLVSGGGTNLQALMDAQARGELGEAQIALVVSNRKAAFALERARGAGIETAVFSRYAIPDDDARDRALCELLVSREIDMVALAGFLGIVGKHTLAAYENRVVNIHPALIPSFCGMGYYGLRVHEAALARGVKVTGATAHIVNGEVDGGPILLQKAVDVLPGDTPETLQKRVMVEAEWVILPKAVRMVAETVSRGIRVRAFCAEDVDAIVRIHRDDDDAWSIPDTARFWLETSLARGCHIETALLDGKIVGHGEWIMDGGVCVLTLLEVDADDQKRGVGRAMLSHIAARAILAGARAIRLIPEVETGSEVFYQKCGFRQTGEIRVCKLPAERNGAAFSRFEGVPFGVCETLPLCFGFLQPSSRHMWEVCNADPAARGWLCPAAKCEAGWVQLRYREGGTVAQAVSWGDNAAELISVARTLAFSLGIKTLTFKYPKPLANVFGDGERADTILERDLNTEEQQK